MCIGHSPRFGLRNCWTASCKSRAAACYSVQVNPGLTCASDIQYLERCFIVCNELRTFWTGMASTVL